MAKTTTSRLCVFLVVNALLCSVFRVDAGTCMTNDVYFSYISNFRCNSIKSN